MHGQSDIYAAINAYYLGYRTQRSPLDTCDFMS